jgi:hypothetical protein
MAVIAFEPEYLGFGCIYINQVVSTQFTVPLSILLYADKHYCLNVRDLYIASNVNLPQRNHLTNDEAR